MKTIWYWRNLLLLLVICVALAILCACLKLPLYACFPVGVLTPLIFMLRYQLWRFEFEDVD